MEEGGIVVNIPSCITNAIHKDVMDNNFFYGAEQMWQRLTDVKEGKVPYLNIDMALLANFMECYYKGFLLASGVNVPAHIMNESHSLVRLTEEIESRICPLQYNMSKTEERDRRNFLFDLGSKYIDCRYNNEQVSKEDFLQCYEWAKKQKELIHNILKPPAKEYHYDEDMYR